MAKNIAKSEHKKFLELSEEFLAAALECAEKGRYNAAGLNAIHSVINANDAFTVFFLQKRASTDHAEAIKLHKDTVKAVGGLKSSVQLKITESLGMKSHAGYEGSKLTKTKTDKLIKNAINVLAWVNKIIEDSK